MLSSLFRRPRSVHLPTQKSNGDISQVKFARRLRKPAYFLVVVPILIWAVARSSDHFLPEQVSKTFEAIGREYADAKVNLGKEGLKNKGKEKIEQELSRKPFCFTVPFWIRKQNENGNLMATTDELALWTNFEIDKARQEALATALRKQTLGILSKQPPFQQAVTTMKPTGHTSTFVNWTYPFNPRQGWEVPCLNITPTKVLWTWRPLPELAVERLYRITHPGLITRSVWEGSKEFCTVLWRRIQTATTQATSEPGRDNAASTSGTASPGAVPGDAKVTDDSAAASRGTTGEETSFPQLNLDTIRRTQLALVSRFPVGDPTSPVKAAITKFQAHFSKAYFRQYKTKPPRGACVLQCQIDIKCAMGMIRVDAWTLYYPKINRTLDLPVIESVTVIPSPSGLFLRRLERDKVYLQKQILKLPKQQEELRSSTGFRPSPKELQDKQTLREGEQHFQKQILKVEKQAQEYEKQALGNDKKALNNAKQVLEHEKRVLEHQRQAIVLLKKMGEVNALKTKLQVAERTSEAEASFRKGHEEKSERENKSSTSLIEKSTESRPQEQHKQQEQPGEEIPPNEIKPSSKPTEEIKQAKEKDPEPSK